MVEAMPFLMESTINHFNPSRTQPHPLHIQDGPRALKENLALREALEAQDVACEAMSKELEVSHLVALSLFNALELCNVPKLWCCFFDPFSLVYLS